MNQKLKIPYRFFYQRFSVQCQQFYSEQCHQLYSVSDEMPKFF
jgi:uncharacterized protein YbaR (Trm112 family)